MRVTNRSLNRNYLKQLNKAVSDYSETNARIASGNRFTQVSEDVSAGAQVLKARSCKYKTETQLENVKKYTDEITNTEQAMSSVSDILTTVKSELMTKALNLPTADTGREAIATQIDALAQEVLTLANQQYSGKYIFGGTAASSAPFTLNDANKVCYNGIPVDSIQQDKTTGEFFYLNGAGEQVEVPKDKDMYIDIGTGLTMTENQVDPSTAMCVTYSGLEIFGFGTTTEDGQEISNNVIEVLQKVADVVRNGDTDEINAYKGQLDSIFNVFSKNLTDIGGKEIALERAQSRLESLSDTYKTRINSLMGIDDKEETTNQSMNDYVLKAVLSLGSSLLPLSLMDYLK